MSGEKKPEIVEFMYFSECGDCGANTFKHQEFLASNALPGPDSRIICIV